jgi:hypothetical protein
VFSDKISLNGYSIYIQTDSSNRFGQGIFGKTVGVIDASTIISDKPIFEIICKDENSYEFNIDVIR